MKNKAIPTVMITSKRPLGVTILAILAFIGAIIWVGSVIAFLSGDWILYSTSYSMRIMWIKPMAF